MLTLPLSALSRRLLVGAAVLAATALTACDGGDPDGGPDGNDGGISENERSQLCAQARGGLAVYWDWFNGTYHPLNQQPTPGPGWSQYFHPTYPLLQFLHPPNYTATTITVPIGQIVHGVDVARNDGQAVWHWIGVYGDVSPGNQAWLDFHLGAVMQELGAAGTPRTVCTNQATGSPAPGIFISYMSRAVEVDGFTIVVAAMLTAVEGVNGGQIWLGTAAAPTNQFTREVEETFLPIHFQLFVGNNNIQDSDGDGFPDDEDDYPYDPSRH